MRVRSDNEPALRGKPWRDSLHTRQVNEMHSAPYLPQQNGVVERMMRTLGEGLRAILQGVDRTMWDHAANYLAYNWNRVPRRNYARLNWAKDLSPLDVRHARRMERRSERMKPGPVDSGYRPMDVCEDENGDLFREHKRCDDEVVFQVNDRKIDHLTTRSEFDGQNGPCEQRWPDADNVYDFEDHDKRENVRVHTNEMMKHEFNSS